MRTRSERWSGFQRFLVLVTVGLLFAVPVADKLPGPYPPDWFAKKFGGTVFDLFDGGLTLAFALITLAEVIVPALCLAALVRGEHRKVPAADGPAGLADYALAGACLLLLALTVGSLVARDYDNAFNDFGYLVGVLVMRVLAFPSAPDR